MANKGRYQYNINSGAYDACNKVHETDSYIQYEVPQEQKEEIVTPDRGQIEHVLSFLSNPVLDILSKEENGYTLNTSLETAKQRISALESFLLFEE